MDFSDIKFSKLKEGALGNYLAELKYVSREIGFNVLCFALTPKGGNIGQTKRQLLNFKEKGYFDISIKNNETFFRLTPKGKSLTEFVKFCTGKMKWDGRWRILIFDIPEKEKYKRDALRRRLNDMGLKQLQQSVWVTPYPLPDVFSDFVADLRVRPYLFSITANEINRENELRIFFGLR
jgi:DNA-binding transcriptional regulator PaaX